MAIKRIAPGKYWARATIKIAGKQHSAERTFSVEAFESAEDVRTRAKQWILDWREERKATPVNAEERTVEALIADYLQSASKRSRKTKQSYANRLEHWRAFSSERGLRFLWQITPQIASDYYDSLKERFVGSGPNSKWEAFTQMLSFERKRPDSALLRNPAEGIETEELDETSRDVWRFTDEEVEVLQSLMITDEERHAFRILEWTGLRTGELRNLPMLHVERAQNTMFLYIKPYKSWRPKTKRSKRRVPIVPMAKESVDFFLERNAGKEYLLGGERVLTENWFVHRFYRLRNDVVAKRPDLAPRFLAKRPGDKRHWLTAHSYRKTCSSRMLDAGLTYDEVRSILGHTDTYMTELYGEYSTQSLASMASRFAQSHTLQSLTNSHVV